MKTLGLDISSSTIGWGILDENGSLVSYGHIKPLKKAKADKLGKGFTYRLLDAYIQITKLLEETKPDRIVIEDYSRKFSTGKSSANTIIVLATYNEVCSLACLTTLGIEPVKYPVRTMRSKVGNHFDEKIPSKDDVFPFILNRYENFVPTRTRFNNIKKEHYDEADGIFAALADLVINENLKKE